MTVENKLSCKMTWRLISRNGSTTEVLQNPLSSHNHPESLMERRHYTLLSSHIVYASGNINIVRICSCIWFCVILTEGALIFNVLSQKFCRNMQTFEGSRKQQIQVTNNKTTKSKTMFKIRFIEKNVYSYIIQKIINNASLFS